MQQVSRAWPRVISLAMHAPFDPAGWVQPRPNAWAVERDWHGAGRAIDRLLELPINPQLDVGVLGAVRDGQISPHAVGRLPLECLVTRAVHVVSVTATVDLVVQVSSVPVVFVHDGVVSGRPIGWRVEVELDPCIDRNSFKCVLGGLRTAVHRRQRYV